MFNKYQQQSAEHFKEHTELSKEQARLLNWAVGLGGETGEVLEVVKHHIFGEEPLDKMALAKELGDVLWYLAAICTTTDINLSAVAELNAAKLDFRYRGTESGYSEEASADRHRNEKAFADTVLYQSLKARIEKTASPVNVIFIGPDGSGKTTVSKIVAEKLGFKYHKCDYRQDDKPQLSLDLLNDQCNVVYDRFYYPDDTIYSRIKLEKDHPGEQMDWSTPYWKKYQLVRNLMADLNTVIIYIDADDEVLKERSKAWADDYISLEDIGNIRTLYHRFLQYARTLPYIIYEYDSSDTPPEILAGTIVVDVHRAQAAFSNVPINSFVTEEDNKFLEEHKPLEDEESEEKNEDEGNA